MSIKLNKWITIIPFAILATSVIFSPAHADNRGDDDKSASIKIFAPGKGDLAGIGSRAFLVDLSIGFNTDLASTGVTPELTGPGPLQNAGPFPGSFSLGTNRDHFPGLVVLLSSTKIGAGPGHNLSNLFNINTVTNQSATSTEIWSTWIIGAPDSFGTVGEKTPSHLFVAVIEGTAPDIVIDMDGNGIFDKKDLKLMGYKVISNTPQVDFFVNGLATGF
ncbi:hypothetical protein [Sulfurirhabdus autotrophica]|uniref:Uncharacterized protein n=1 Tax=Sulfurirhabdus autotrophica TaxID=1706046 RepID=A0A4R3Y676_9PROT|nr:hypothetical protein [Sulfurirhabdus autotrophica]TCV86348.1 hypothetical protein EDC63_10736 [Sulfurirhabdus autotrophica]